MTTFPRSWHRETAIETMGTISSFGRRTSYISIGTHSGTHIDAPSHFIAEGISVDKIDLSRFFGSAQVFDLTNVPTSWEISRDELKTLLKGYMPGNSIILNFGWGSNFNNPKKYYDNQPWIAESAAEYLVTLSPPVLAYDLAMLDNPLNGYGCTLDSPIHKILLGNGIPLIENSVFPQRLPQHLYYSVFPLRLEGLDGSPVRFIGWGK
jgi:arylformamidase